MIQSVHHKGYKLPIVKRCWIPKPGKQEKRLIRISCVRDQVLTTTIVSYAIFHCTELEIRLAHYILGSESL
jgi:hypothetical protein